MACTSTDTRLVVKLTEIQRPLGFIMFSSRAPNQNGDHVDIITIHMRSVNAQWALSTHQSRDTLFQIPSSPSVHVQSKLALESKNVAYIQLLE